MKGEWMIRVALVATILAGIASCGGTQVAEGGIGGSGVSMGSVSAIGSIWVNGVEYDTTGATITFADDDGADVVDTYGTAGGDTLRLGMVLTVKGTIDAGGVSGTATSVSYADNLEGPISSVPNANTLIVLGQSVIVDNLTKDETGVVLDNTSGFAVTDWVEVSGFVDVTGSIHATYIERKAAATEVELKGAITLVDSSHFTIGGLTVVVADTAGLATGDFVEVRGLASDLLGSTLTASSVELKSAVLDSEDHDKAEMEGIVTSTVTPSGQFYLGAQLVWIASGAEFNGGLAANIVPGVRLEVEGSYSDGVLIAEEISFEDGIEIEADIDTKDATAGTITLDGLGLTVKVDEVLTAMEGAANLAVLNPGDHLKLRARDTGTELLATKLAVVSPSSKIELQGPLQAKDPDGYSVTILGIPATGFSEYEIDSEDAKVTAETFFDTVSVDDLVELEGTWDGATLIWETIELDD